MSQGCTGIDVAIGCLNRVLPPVPRSVFSSRIERASKEPTPHQPRGEKHFTNMHHSDDSGSAEHENGGDNSHHQTAMQNLLHNHNGVHQSEHHHQEHPHHHISHAVVLTAEVADPATAQHLVEEEEKWAADKISQDEISSTESPHSTSEKNGITLNEEENGEDLRREESKASLAIMMANFPDGGRWGWSALVGATLIAFSTFGMTWRRPR
jgi:hypothetical protein